MHVCHRRLASVQSAFHAVEAAAQAHAKCTFADTFLEQAYRLVVEKLRAACQLRLCLVCLCLSAALLCRPAHTGDLHPCVRKVYAFHTMCASQECLQSNLCGLLSTAMPWSNQGFLHAVGAYTCTNKQFTTSVSFSVCLPCDVLCCQQVVTVKGLVGVQAEQRLVKSTKQHATPQQESIWKQRKSSAAHVAVSSSFHEFSHAEGLPAAELSSKLRRKAILLKDNCCL